jgi:hypothetical protein
MSKYRMGIESTINTLQTLGAPFADSQSGMPLDEFVEFQAGKEFEEVRKVTGLPFPCDHELLTAGAMPLTPPMNMNLSLQHLEALMASCHYVASDLANKWSIYPAVGTGKKVAHLNGATPTGNVRTLSLIHERETATGAGGGDGMVAVVTGAVMNSLTLTFPAGNGGPVKMGFDVRGMAHDYEEDEGALVAFLPPAGASIDLVCQDFAFYYGNRGGALTRFYPATDVVVNITPVVTVEKRGGSLPRWIYVDDYLATVEFAFPWDTETDPLQDDFDGTEGGGDGDEPIQKEIRIGNTGAYNTAPAAEGEFLLTCRGQIQEEPGTEGEGILRDTATMRCHGVMATGNPPYQMQFYDENLFS